jgi:hypothetical protein
MEARWQEMLARYQLQYFHMVDCAHGLSPFQALDKAARIAAEIEAINIIRDTMAHGIAVSLDPKEYDGERVYFVRSQYHDKIDFYFESGHASEAECNILMKKPFAMPHLKRDHRHEAHSYCDKRIVTPLSPASATVVPRSPLPTTGSNSGGSGKGERARSRMRPLSSK